MVKIGKSPPRLLGRAVVAAALMAGTSAVFATSAHAATVHANPAAAPACMSGTLQPGTINMANSGSDHFNAGGSASVTVNGATVKFTSDGTSNQLGVTQSGPFNKVQTGGCESLSNTGGTANFTDSQVGQCSFASYDYTVKADGSDILNVLLQCQNGSVTLTASVIGLGPGGGAATPELGSGELLATGLLPLGIFLYRRRRQQAAK